jgi:hypothetical protein
MLVTFLEPAFDDEKGDLMSKDATATIYAKMLTDSSFRGTVCESVLNDWDLTQGEREILLEEAASTELQNVLSNSKVMRHLRHGVSLSPDVASALGAALNNARGLPRKAVKDPGHTSGATDCCPWNKPPVPWDGGISE